MNDKNTTIIDTNQTKIPLTDEMIEEQAKKKIKKKFIIWLIVIIVTFLPALIFLFIWKKKKYALIETKQYSVVKTKCRGIYDNDYSGPEIEFENGARMLYLYNPKVSEGEYAYLLYLNDSNRKKNPLCIFNGAEYIYN